MLQKTLTQTAESHPGTRQVPGGFSYKVSISFSTVLSFAICSRKRSCHFTSDPSDFKPPQSSVFNVGNLPLWHLQKVDRTVIWPQPSRGADGAAHGSHFRPQ